MKNRWAVKRENAWRNEEWIVNTIGDEGAKSISESLKINTTLKELTLRSEEKISSEKRKRGMNEEMKNE